MKKEIITCDKCGKKIGIRKIEIYARGIFIEDKWDLCPECYKKLQEYFK